MLITLLSPFASTVNRLHQWLLSAPTGQPANCYLLTVNSSKCTIHWSRRYQFCVRCCNVFCALYHTVRPYACKQAYFNTYTQPWLIKAGLHSFQNVCMQAQMVAPTTTTTSAHNVHTHLLMYTHACMHICKCTHTLTLTTRNGTTPSWCQHTLHSR